MNVMAGLTFRWGARTNTTLKFVFDSGICRTCELWALCSAEDPIGTDVKSIVEGHYCPEL